MVFKSKYENLKANKLVMEWYKNLQGGSLITADNYLRTLGRYCKLTKNTPESILKKAKSGELKHEFIEFVNDLQNQGKNGSYLVLFKKTLNSWLSFNNIDQKLQGIKIRGANLTPTIQDERPPTKEELDKILRNASLRGRAIIGILAFSGIRPESLGNYKGTDGIVLKDIEGLEITDQGINFKIFPAMLKIRATLSKKGNAYFTFLPEQACKYIKDYLDLRIRNGEKLNLESPLIRADPRGSHSKATEFISTMFLLRDVKKAIKKSGFSFRPYVMRVYFASAMDIAESKGLISHSWRAFFMGHKGDIEARYSTNKRLPPDVIEQMREAYKRCQKYLITELPQVEESNLQELIKKQMLLVAGFKPEEIEKMNISEMSNEEITQKIREKLMGSLKESLVKNAKGQFVINKDKVEDYISKGFEFVADLGNGKIIMKMP
ncbi:MAG: site-specific integrase [Thermoplasmata archaeon]